LIHPLLWSVKGSGSIQGGIVMQGDWTASVLQSLSLTNLSMWRFCLVVLKLLVTPSFSLENGLNWGENKV